MAKSNLYLRLKHYCPLAARHALLRACLEHDNLQSVDAWTRANLNTATALQCLTQRNPESPAWHASQSPFVDIQVLSIHRRPVGTSRNSIQARCKVDKMLQALIAVLAVALTIMVMSRSKLKGLQRVGPSRGWFYERLPSAKREFQLRGREIVKEAYWKVYLSLPGIRASPDLKA